MRYALVLGASICYTSALDILEQTSGGLSYELLNITYFANAAHPRTSLAVSDCDEAAQVMPLTVVATNQSFVTGEDLQATVFSYLADDDVLSPGFLLHAVYLTSLVANATIDPMALSHLHSLGIQTVYLDTDTFASIPTGFDTATDTSPGDLQPGPYTAIVTPNALELLDTYRLYPDVYRTFVTGAYATQDGSDAFRALPLTCPRHWAPLIPVPSRIPFRHDPRPLAGVRVAVKDLFDMRGLQTSAGSLAWVRITPVATATAPALQQLIDQGAVLVGKYKPSQFAGGGSPWTWIDAQSPFNPRGDGYLTCAASSSGGGCAVAAYDWLDVAVGTDTAVSMRRPAAVSGTYGNRPSQGIMALDGVVAQNWAQDTAGVFARDPRLWMRFAKAWYVPELQQESNITGLSPLVVPDARTFPTQILYPVEYFPLANPAAQALVDRFVAQLSRHLHLTTRRINLTQTVTTGSIFEGGNNWDRIYNSSTVLTLWSQHEAVARPLMTAWANLEAGRFPPVDAQWRREWTQLFDPQVVNGPAYTRALRDKARSVEWFERDVLQETEASCSQSVMLCHAANGGLPSFREQELNEGPNATLLGVAPDPTAMPCDLFCALFGCAESTIPLGQVPYYSPVTRVTEQLPITIDLAVRRGCDLVLFNLIDELAAVGILRAVKTGREAF
ncbi:amidase family protein [Aspergillus steynii IBT 23096]|uniref:Amidase family protein n=1 Tax=Aspergillus steynii IBT 23096 TaxID=1392250 RepID=A0A2I2GL58_9EURO|nr:amidase family protein [Aspergillus steynii IBT 23096]PLB53610.1 amidase family protein [Aspergillus steynii IBT 23096]